MFLNHIAYIIRCCGSSRWKNIIFGSIGVHNMDILFDVLINMKVKYEQQKSR